MLSRASAIAALFFVACSGPGKPRQEVEFRTPGQTTFEVSGDETPAVASDFTPPPQLADPLPGDPRAFGADYLESVAGAIGPRWSSFLEDLRVRLAPHEPLNDARLASRIEFVVESDGSLTDVVVIKKSGLAAYDAAALEVLADAAPVPVPPEGVRGDDGVVRVRWLFARDARQAGVATAVLRPIRFPAERAVPILVARAELGEAASRVARANQLKSPARAELLDVIARAAVREAADRGDPGAIASLEKDDVLASREVLVKLAATDGALARAEAFGALAKIADPSLALSAREAIAEMNTPERVVGAAAAAWASLGPEASNEIVAGVGELLESTDPQARRRAFVVAATVSVPSALQEATGLLRDLEALDLAAPVVVRAAAAGSSVAKKRVLAELSGKVAERRIAFARAAAAARSLPAGFRTPLERLLRDRDERVRAAGIIAIANSWPMRVGRVAPRLRRETSPLVLTALADGLAGDTSRRATKALTRLLADRDAGVRARAARGLWGRPRAAALLAPALRDSDERVVRAALPAREEAALRDLATAGGSLSADAVAARLSVGPATDLVSEVLATASPELRLAASLAWLAARRRARLGG